MRDADRDSGDPGGEPLTSVLLIEDDPAQQRAMSAGLQARGYLVHAVADGASALERVEPLRPDVAILDLGLPDLDGLDVCRHLLLRGVCPVVVVTADAVEDRMIEALDLGAEDYVLKPVSLNVLDARLRRVLRSTAAGRPAAGDVLRCGDVVVDVAGHVVVVDGETVHLQPLQFAALTVLARNEGRVVTYPSLARAVYGDDRSGSSSLEGMRTCVASLRRTLGSGPRRPAIHTEARVGYRLTVPA